MTGKVLLMERPDFLVLIIKPGGCQKSQCSGDPHFHLKQDPPYSRKEYAIHLSYEEEIQADKGKSQRERGLESEVFESSESPVTSTHTHL